MQSKLFAIKAIRRTNILALPLVDSSPIYKRRTRRNKRVLPNSVTPKTYKLDAASLAASLQLKDEQRQLVYSLIGLSLKVGLLLISFLSLIKLGFAAHKRLYSHIELSSILKDETASLINLERKFDSFFTIGGERRLMQENEQFIAPDRVRVIWR